MCGVSVTCTGSASQRDPERADDMATSGGGWISPAALRAVTEQIPADILLGLNSNRF